MGRVIFLLFLAACSLNQGLAPKYNYPKDIELVVNGKKGLGLILVPKSQVYKIEATAKGKLNMFSYSSCHRNDYQEDAWDKGWFQSKYEVNLEYKPGQDELPSSQCPLTLEGYEKIKGRHSWATIYFEDESYTLPANLACNGVYSGFKGNSICTTKAGLIQKIVFANEVIHEKQENCPSMDSTDNKTFSFEIGVGECVYTFMDMERRSHKLTTYGWDQIILRGD